ncbi:MAG: hypothetical protein Q9213_005769 [Squamulea squamosa]
MYVSPSPDGHYAAAEKIEINNVEVIPREDIGKADYVEKFPLSRGKIPGLEAPNGLRLTETIAIATYLARIHDVEHLLGDGTFEQEAQVLSWMSWANQELLPTLAAWYLPLIPFQSDPVSASPSSIAQGRNAALALLSTLENYLKGNRYLVGHKITLADIMVVMYIARGLEWVLDSHWRSDHHAIMRQFSLVTNWEPVCTVVPDLIMVEKAPDIVVGKES